MRGRTITIRGVPEAVLTVLRTLSERNRRSLNAELLILLERAAATVSGLAAGTGREVAVPPYGKSSRALRPGRDQLLAGVDRAELARICRRFHVRSLAAFGSTARGEDSPSSDLDLLVEFEPGMTPGFGIVTATQDLARVFRRPVDLVTRRGLSPGIRERVLAEAVTLYHA